MVTREKVGSSDNTKLDARRLTVSIEQYAGDDLESLGYVLLYFLRGSLPWQGLKTARVEDKYDCILKMKQSMEPEQLCDGLPHEFVLYFNHVRSLYLHDQPNFRYLRQIFSQLFRRKGFEYDNVFDWTEQMYATICNKDAQVSTKTIQSTAPAQKTRTGRPRDERYIPERARGKTTGIKEL